MRLESAERKKMLEKGISMLPENQRMTLVLCDLQGMSYEEAAIAMDCPIGTIRSRLNRGRISLKNILSADMELFNDKERPIDERRKTK